LNLEQFGQLNKTVFMGVGELDEMVSRDETEEVANVIPNATFYLMEQTEHPLPKVDPVKLSQLIENYLS